jgi:hypothetical protein
MARPADILTEAVALYSSGPTMSVLVYMKKGHVPEKKFAPENGRPCIGHVVI